MNTPLEILAPAGDLNCAVAAIESGANAVYVGLPGFNARARAADFSIESLGRLCDYAHSRHAKVYVAVNTLVKESELGDLMRVLVSVMPFGIDAFILQDLGVLTLFKTYFPHVALHASTQMGFHHSLGLQTAKNLGFSRVILERQVKWDELEMMLKNAPLEVEVFVHGALCVSLSGNCLMSSFEGGCSGNRGRCKQSCRRRFKQDETEGFFLSPTDLSLIEQVDTLKKWGVSSLKIEGRMRKSDHVMSIVKALISAREEGVQYAKKMMASVYGRPTSVGFWDKMSISNLIDPNELGAQGLLVGKVIFQNQGLTRVKCLQIPQKGDRIRIQNEDGHKGVMLTLLDFAKRKDEIEFYCKERVKAGSGVYRIGESLPVFERLSQHLPPFKRAIDVKINIHACGCKISVLGREYSKKFQLSPAENHPLIAEKVETAFRIVPYEFFCAGKIEVEISGNYFMSAGDLKQLRQAFWQYVNDEIYLHIQAEDELILTRFALDYQQYKPVQKELNPLHLNKDDSLFSDTITGMKILPFFIPESKLEFVFECMKKMYEKGVRRFGVTRVEHIDMLEQCFEKNTFSMIVLPPLQITNSLSSLFLKKRGIECGCAHIELSREDLKLLLEKTQLPLYQYINGCPVLMSTRACLKEKAILKHDTFQWKVETLLPFDIFGLIDCNGVKIPLVDGYNLLYDDRFGIAQSENCFNFKRNWE